MQLQKKTYSNIFFILIMTIHYSLTISISYFLDQPFIGYKDFLELLFHFIIIIFATFGLFGILNYKKKIFYIIYPLLVLFGSILAYFRFEINVSLTPQIIDVFFSNDLLTSLDLVSLYLIIYMLVQCLFLFFFISWRERINNKENLMLFLFSFLIVIFTNLFIPRIQRPIKERLPFNLFYELKNYIFNYKIVLIKRKKINLNSYTKADLDLIVVLVLGESLRSDHLSINGYKRKTTPNIENNNFISLPNVYSEHTHTSSSLPHILTRANGNNLNFAFEEESFISIFNHTNFNTFWLSNQNPPNTIISFIQECKNIKYNNIGYGNYNYNQWLDEDLLPELKNIISQKKEKKLIILHTIGSHWWYNSHFNEKTKKFTPTANSRIISATTNQEKINSYDNTIVYTDLFLFEIKKIINRQNAILIYLSDHGESLGEDGKWLHANAGKYEHLPASLFWFSEKFKNNQINKEKINNLINNKNSIIKTDFLFHSILSISSIYSPFYNKCYDIFYKN